MNLTTTPIRRRPALRLALGALLAAIGALALMPASGHAAKANFGADLHNGPVNPVAMPLTCGASPGKPCTRVPVYYDTPSHAGMLPNAPHTGKIKKIKLVANSPGKLRIQLAKVKGFDTSAPTKVKRNGPVIHYQGTGQVEKFKVKIPVKKYEWLAFKTKYAGTLQCSGGFDNEMQFQPTLKPAAPLAQASSSSDCTHTIGARMKY